MFFQGTVSTLWSMSTNKSRLRFPTLYGSHTVTLPMQILALSTLFMCSPLMSFAVQDVDGSTVIVPNLFRFAPRRHVCGNAVHHTAHVQSLDPLICLVITFWREAFIPH